MDLLRWQLRRQMISQQRAHLLLTYFKVAIFFVKRKCVDKEISCRKLGYRRNFSFQLDRKKTLFPLRRDCGVKLNFLASDICVHPIFSGLNFDFDFIHHWLVLPVNLNYFWGQQIENFSQLCTKTFFLSSSSSSPSTNLIISVFLPFPK